MIAKIMEKYQHYLSDDSKEHLWSQDEINYLLEDNRKLREVLELVAAIYCMDERNSNLNSVRYYARKALGFDEP